jgi:hypothetical protein
MSYTEDDILKTFYHSYFFVYKINECSHKDTDLRVQDHDIHNRRMRKQLNNQILLELSLNRNLDQDLMDLIIHPKYDGNNIVMKWYEGERQIVGDVR